MLLVRNRSDWIYDVRLEMTFELEGTPRATASGALNNLAPGGMRGLRLSPPRQQRWTVWQLVGEWKPVPEGSRRSEGADRVKFGRWYEIPDLGLDLDVTNADEATQSIALQAVLFKGATFVGVATGTHIDLPPGHTRQATLLMDEPMPSFDRLVFAADLLQH
jgi:hypothetical protein